MNYYEHHIGDYDTETSHLNWVEDLAYRRLVCLYYRKEKPIPADFEQACRLVRAANREQKQAVKAVLDEFFILKDDGHHQKTCDEVIQKYQAGEPEREVKKTNENLRMTRHREERAALFKKLHDAGQHAPWNIAIAELRELANKLPTAPKAPATETLPVTEPVTATATPATATQKPDTNTHKPDKEEAGVKPPAPSRQGVKKTLGTYLEECRLANTKPLPPDHFIREYCRDAKISDEMLQVAWVVFRDEHATGTKKTKKYIDWPAVFANAVKGCWSKLWYTDPEGSVSWTSRGLQEKGVLDARQKNKDKGPSA
ncbi:MAG: YdaU family protein [Pseudomonadota bacterium]